MADNNLSLKVVLNGIDNLSPKLKNAITASKEATDSLKKLEDQRRLVDKFGKAKNEAVGKCQ
jgi:hypothetical protein